ncbi:CBS domain-containing protein [Desertivirga xinjiangensis]|uniref:CBS domain-containing protein n=1 Tax=Desertivirga xinjiangensis TaxID=539206 RepID=UPI00210BE7E5|nr:CBS domain-containing protein [Pedobacter xinjiangensis]
MKTVQHILQNKKRGIFSVRPELSVYEALEVMMDKNISALLITEGKVLLGIFTERDYARKIILQGKASRETSIKDVMSRKVMTVTVNTTIDECMKIMTENHIRHLPVVENTEVTGMISIGDLVKCIMEAQEATIKQLENYISS